MFMKTLLQRQSCSVSRLRKCCMFSSSKRRGDPKYEICEESSWKDNDFGLLIGGVVIVVGVGSMALPSIEKKRADSLPITAKYLRRVPQTPRSDWEEQCEKEGFPFAAYPGVSWPSSRLLPSSWGQDFYWNEEAAFEVHPQGMWDIEEAAHELHSLCLGAVDDVVKSDDLLTRFGIPKELWPTVRETWRTRQTDLAGRFDFLWDGENPPKLAEYNADTPTVLVESAGAQRNWLLHFQHNSQQKDATQFNVLAEALEAAFREMRDNYDRTVGAKEASENPFSLIFTTQKPCAESEFLEERATTAYMLARAKAAGVPSQMMDLEVFDDPQIFKSIFGPSKYNFGAPSLLIWKLYPYEWLIQEKLGVALCDPSFQNHGVGWIEPAWKLILSSKAILAYLWEKHPGHKNLLPAFYSWDDVPPRSKQSNAISWVAKPCFGREGVGIIYSDDFCSGDAFQKAVETSVDSSGQHIIADFTAISDELGPAEHADDVITNPLETLPRMMISKLKLVFYNWFHQMEPTVFSLRDRPDNQGDKQFGYHVGKPIVQQYYAPVELAGRSIITSAWVVRGVPVAACFREDPARTTNDDSCFVPHYVRPSGAPSQTKAYPMTQRQRRLRSELYGTDPVTRNEESISSNDTKGHPIRSNATYLNEGYSGIGTSPVGGGGRRQSPPRIGSSSDTNSDSVAKGGTGRKGREEWSKPKARAPRSSAYRTGTTSRGAAHGGRSFGG